jgi:hypothetical protein
MRFNDFGIKHPKLGRLTHNPRCKIGRYSKLFINAKSTSLSRIRSIAIMAPDHLENFLYLIRCGMIESVPSRRIFYLAAAEIVFCRSLTDHRAGVTF